MLKVTFRQTNRPNTKAQTRLFKAKNPPFYPYWVIFRLVNPNSKTKTVKKHPRLAKCIKALSVLYRNLRRFKLTRGGKLIADQPAEWGLRVVLSGHFYASLDARHERLSRLVLHYRNTSRSPDQNKQTKQIVKKVKVVFSYLVCLSNESSDKKWPLNTCK